MKYTCEKIEKKEVTICSALISRICTGRYIKILCHLSTHSHTHVWNAVAYKHSTRQGGKKRGTRRQTRYVCCRQMCPLYDRRKKRLTLFNILATTRSIIGLTQANIDTVCVLVAPRLWTQSRKLNFYFCYTKFLSIDLSTTVFFQLILYISMMYNLQEIKEQKLEYRLASIGTWVFRVKQSEKKMMKWKIMRDIRVKERKEKKENERVVC